jgi:endonuclease-3
MKKIERAQIIQEILDDLYPNLPIPLNHQDPYTLLIAVLLSAQCTDKRVNLVTPALFKCASTPEKMRKLSVEQIKSFIQTCGLANNKAKNIKALSEILCTKFNGEVPKTFKDLEQLPGVGHKTASVVMIHAF